jgi:hypothetical protein
MAGGYSQEQLADILGRDRRTIRNIIKDKCITPISEVVGKDGRKYSRYAAIDLFRADNPAKVNAVTEIVCMLGIQILDPRSEFIRTILKYLPEGSDSVPALTDIVERGWDEVALYLGHIPETKW